MMTTMTTGASGPTTDGPVRRIRQTRYSVRTRITAAVALLVAIALASAGLLVWALGHDRIQEAVPVAVDQELAELEEFQANGVDPSTGGSFTAVPPLIREFLRRNVPSQSELMLGVWDGRVQVSSASSRRELAGDPAFAAEVLSRTTTGGGGTVDSRWGSVYYEVLPVRALKAGESPGAFVVAYFLEEELEQLERTLRTYAVAAVLALVLVTAVAAWQAGRLLAPVRTLRETADEISETDLSRRIPESGNDDLTDLTRTVNAMLGRLEGAFTGQRAFLDDAGHELRTPLTILQGHLEVMDGADPDDVERTRELLLDEVQRMTRLVEDMILLTKAERPDFLHPRPVDVDSLLDAVLGKTRALGDRRWVLDGRAGGTALVDEQRVTQALVQLAQNAVKHTSEGDEIALGGAARDGSVLLWVRDTGPGVPDDEKPTIFRRFSRGQQSVGSEGVGLGLSIVTAIAQAHGGGVHVEDAEPHGARFVMTLPRTRKESTWPAS